jgi:hypothetical protein
MRLVITATNVILHFCGSLMGIFSGFVHVIVMKFLKAASSTTGSESDYEKRKEELETGL